MAVSKNQVGFKCEFVEAPAEYLQTVSVQFAFISFESLTKLHAVERASVGSVLSR